MARLFVEDDALPSESPRATVGRLMHELDQQAAVEGHRVDGDVTIGKYDRHPLTGTERYRLEADVIPSV